MADQVFKPSWPAGLYANARPSYPLDLVGSILREAGRTAHSQPLNVVDLGAGTGICTRILIDASINDGIQLASITALDAAPNMLAQLDADLFTSNAGTGKEAYVPSLQREGKLSRSMQTHVAQATFETIDLTQLGLQGKADLISIAQAFHWCSDFDQAFKNFARALKPGGVVALIWNLEDREAAKWVAEVRDTYEVYESGSPQYRHGAWRKMYDTPGLKDNFDILDPVHITRAIPTTVDGVCQRVLSKSYVSVQSGETQSQIEEHIKNFLKPDADDKQLQRVWIDKEKNIFEYPYRTDLLMFRKK